VDVTSGYEWRAVADGDDQAPDVRFEFEHDRRAPEEARQEMDQLLNVPDDPIADDVRLAASELVTNVVTHTDDGGELRAWDPRGGSGCFAVWVLHAQSTGGSARIAELVQIGARSELEDGDDGGVV